MKKKYNKRLSDYFFSGFTLAEVLITLGIIGIVAAMTIPTISKNIRHNELQQQFKKSYSIISQAVAQTKIDLGVDDLEKTYTFYDGTKYPHATDYTDSFYKQLKILRNGSYLQNPKNYNNTQDASFHGIGTEKPNRILTDGSSINCSINAGNINISVDLNGPLKKPNRAGYDIFVFYVDKRNAVQPYGTPNNPNPQPQYYVCNKASTADFNGLGCGYYANIDKNPDDQTKGYWESLD